MTKMPWSDQPDPNEGYTAQAVEPKKAPPKTSWWATDRETFQKELARRKPQPVVED